MAGGNLSPRQKMINMMYLVLTALLALNVSREVMDAFYEVMIGQESSIETVEKQNASIYAAFEAAAAENPVKAGPWKDKANEVKAKSSALYNELERIKAELVERSGGVDEESQKPNKMDDREAAANYMLIEQHGVELKNAMAAYRDFLKENAEGNAGLIAALDNTFDLSDKVHDGAKESWEKSKFEHYPLISVLTFLTGMQSDVRTSEANVIDHLQRNIGKSDLKFTGVRTVVMPKSTFVSQGGEYEADVFLAAFDDTQDPTVIINGQELAAEDIVGGVAKVRFPANRVGETTWNGEIRLTQNGEEKVFPVEGAFNVAPPNVVIAASKMNVLYRGVDNPVEVSVPGVDPANIIVSNPEFKKDGKGNYIADVTKFRGNEIKVAVSVREGDKVTPMGSKVYRIKSLPDASGAIFGKSEGLMSANLMKKGTVEAKFNNFDFELDLKVTGFQIIVPPFAPIECTGSTLNSNAKAALDKAKPGTTVIVRNIKATTAKGMKPKVSAITIDLN